MDEATQNLIINYAVMALGGVVGANILGGLLRGGGGVVGRTIIGALGGAGLGYAATQMPQIAEYSNMLSFSMAAPYGGHLQNLLTGAVGGGVLGLVTALIIRPRG